MFYVLLMYSFLLLHAPPGSRCTMGPNPLGLLRLLLAHPPLGIPTPYGYVTSQSPWTPHMRVIINSDLQIYSCISCFGSV